MLEKVVRNSTDYIKNNKRIINLFNTLSGQIENAIQGRQTWFSWQALMTGKKTEKDDLRKFIIVQPFMDYSSLYPAEKALRTIKTASKTLNRRN